MWGSLGSLGQFGKSGAVLEVWGSFGKSGAVWDSEYSIKCNIVHCIRLCCSERRFVKSCPNQQELVGLFIFGFLQFHKKILSLLCKKVKL